jgi:CRP/FNR family putative post-exponential-phase nitrogen-starvation transcriptional regulator
MSETIAASLVPVLKPYAQVRGYPGGTTLIEKGEPMTHLRIIQQGKAKMVVYTSEAKELLLFFTREYEVLGDLEFFAPGVCTVTVKTVTDCELLEVELGVVQQLVADNPHLLRLLGSLVAFKLRRANNKQSVNILYPLRERLASYLTCLVSGSEREDLSSDSLGDLADLLGSSYRHLNRVITQLCEEAILKRTPWGIAVIDWPRLKRIARDIYF